MSFSVVSCFSGCGGSSLGYKLAGGKVLMAVEFDKNAAETYRLNFPDTPVFEGDIATLSVEEVLKRIGLKSGELDIFDGSPPCQGFSTAGRKDMKQFADPRNELFREYVRLLRGLKPKVFVMENVAGMVRGKNRVIFSKIMQELKASGYKVKARLLNAMYFGVPQSRTRLIFVGVRNDLGVEPSHPQAKTKPITVAMALQNLDLSKSTTISKAREMENHATMRWVKFCKAGEKGAKYHPKGSFFNAIRLPLNKPAPTICKTGGGGQACLCHHTEDRYLCAEELKRLASFPDDFRFVGNLQDTWARIGNCVPPKFMQAIAEHIRDNILGVVNG